MCAVPLEARKEHQILEMELQMVVTHHVGPLEEQSVLCPAPMEELLTTDDPVL